MLKSVAVTGLKSSKIQIDRLVQSHKTLAIPVENGDEIAFWLVLKLGLIPNNIQS